MLLPAFTSPFRLHALLSNSARSFAPRAEEQGDLLTAAREWLSKLEHNGVEDFLKSNSQMSFSTSSGAGGQNVNRYFGSFL